ncbi:MAG: topoisomerase IV, partial [Ruminiclostridium sp.]|nr:topoisomerase IV [Ruminiclostridium sp.]
NNNIGIAVSMASNICSFNLREICETTIAVMKDPEHDVSATLRGPDFPGGGFIVYDEEEMQKIYRTGRGSILVRGKYSFDSDSRCIEITEIPPTTTVEAIIDKVLELVKLGKINEISDIRDETDLSGLKLTLDLKKGKDPDEFMRKLFRLTPLQDPFSCNFNILIAGNPRVMGVYEIISEWISFRIECVKRMIYFELGRKKEKLHLLLGLKKILLDIDKAIKIIRETEEEAEVVPNLMIGFGIDEQQAEYVAEIKLRHINREYILRRTEETDQLREEIADMEDMLESPRRIKKYIIDELTEIAEKYGSPRRTLFAQAFTDNEEEEETIPDYTVNCFLTKEGYFKRITSQSLRMSSEQKLKEGDEIIFAQELSGKTDLLLFTNKFQVYKTCVNDFEDTKASLMGDYLPAKLEMEQDESIIKMIETEDYSEHMILFFRNGKCAKVPLSSFETKTRRKKLANAYFSGSELIAMYKLKEDCDFILQSEAGKVLIFSSALVLPKAARDTQGVQVMRLTRTELKTARPYEEGIVQDPEKYVSKTVPAAGSLLKTDIGQLTLKPRPFVATFILDITSAFRYEPTTKAS